MQKRNINPIILIIAIGILILMGPFAWQKWFSEQSPEFPDYVDQGIRDEDMPIFQERIDTLEAEKKALDEAGKRDISLLLRLGNAYATVGYYGIAGEHYLDILSTHPNDTPALENLGWARLKVGDVESAEAYWRRAKDIVPREITYLRLANDIINEKHPERKDEIIPLLEEATEELGQKSGIMVALGNRYYELEMLEEAISHYEIAYQLSQNGGILERLNELYDEQDQKFKETLRKAQ